MGVGWGAFLESIRSENNFLWKPDINASPINMRHVSELDAEKQVI
jgi:hypothetical protein